MLIKANSMTSPRNSARPVPADDAAIRAAAAHLATGELVAFPTETVYGLGADATSDAAVAKIYAAKGRPSFNPLIVHCADMETARRFAVIEGPALDLARAFWPGPFTLVAPRHADCPLAPRVSAGLATVAIRVPRHPVAQALLAAFNGPIAAPSANRSGRISPTRAEHVAAELGGKVAMILDGGPCEKGLESTIVGIHDGRVELLRPGSITPDAIAAACGLPVVGSGPEAAITAPGQLASHYAPRARLRLNAVRAAPHEALLAFGPNVPEGAAAVLNLSPTGDLEEAARNLFAMLRRLDDAGYDAIAAMPVPEEGAGIAINDRLRRAAAPRDAA